jgi:hypothetical protein
MKIHLEFEPHESNEAKHFMQAIDDSDLLDDFRSSLRSILKHSDDDAEKERAEWARALLEKLEE